MRLTIVFLFLSLVMQGQSSNPEQTSQTSIGLTFGPNITLSTLQKNFSVGGDWGVHMDHLFADSRFGFSTAINYKLLHVGNSPDPIVAPGSAIEFDLLETGVFLIYRPFEEFQNLRLRPGVVHALILGFNRGNFPGLDYNIMMVNFGIEYGIPTDTNLSVLVTWDYRYFSIYKDQFGNHLTSMLNFKFGLKS